MREKRKGMITMNQKLEELIATAHLNDLIRQKKDEEKKANTIVWVLAIIGAIAAIAGIAFAVVKYFTPTYLDDDFYSDDEVVNIDNATGDESTEK